ncbi:hypothetical protein AVEN_252325-1 [Araneus ventricosus]|uniref:Uncharacterized protein n=1 Tax=Araneus ventricosus TaxID=182803 RepID=A0A4Y2AQK0_ARAVE|nr:hypothetical protein AVEN_252325-1 [Araneus ventricosus]
MHLLIVESFEPSGGDVVCPWSAVSGSLNRLDGFLNLDGVVKLRIRNDAIVMDNQVGRIDFLRYMVTNFIEHGVEHPRISRYVANGVPVTSAGLLHGPS